MLQLQLLPENYAVCRFSRTETPEFTFLDEQFWSLSVAGDEVSLICREIIAPSGCTKSAGWRILQVMGPLAFNQIGIMAGLTDVLAKQKISILALSTYDTDYLLIQDNQLQMGLTVLRVAGYQIDDPLSSEAQYE
jgi:uncharacterized protein